VLGLGPETQNILVVWLGFLKPYRNTEWEELWEKDNQKYKS
jgi:hypothetical protein